MDQVSEMERVKKKLCGSWIETNKHSPTEYKFLCNSIALDGRIELSNIREEKGKFYITVHLKMKNVDWEILAIGETRVLFDDGATDVICKKIR